MQRNPSNSIVYNSLSSSHISLNIHLYIKHVYNMYVCLLAESTGFLRTTRYATNETLEKRPHKTIQIWTGRPPNKPIKRPHTVILYDISCSPSFFLVALLNQLLHCSYIFIWFLVGLERYIFFTTIRNKYVSCSKYTRINSFQI